MQPVTNFVFFSGFNNKTPQRVLLSSQVKTGDEITQQMVDEEGNEFYVVFTMSLCALKFQDTLMTLLWRSC